MEHTTKTLRSFFQSFSNDPLTKPQLCLLWTKGNGYFIQTRPLGNQLQLPGGGRCPFIHPSLLQSSCYRLEICQMEGATCYLLQMPLSGNLISNLPSFCTSPWRAKGTRSEPILGAFPPRKEKPALVTSSAALPSALQIHKDSGRLRSESSNLWGVGISILQRPVIWFYVLKDLFPLPHFLGAF